MTHHHGMSGFDVKLRPLIVQWEGLDEFFADG